MMNMTQHIEAEIHYLAREEGGRHTPVGSGYRGQFYYDGRDWDAVQTFIGKDCVDPGDDARATIWFVSPELHRGKVAVGMRFAIREGARTVARGIVTKLLGLEAPSGA
jgi:translation elongation factor EF-Tu-like GTPase